MRVRQYHALNVRLRHQGHQQVNATHGYHLTTVYGGLSRHDIQGRTRFTGLTRLSQPLVTPVTFIARIRNGRPIYVTRGSALTSFRLSRLNTLAKGRGVGRTTQLLGNFVTYHTGTITTRPLSLIHQLLARLAVTRTRLSQRHRHALPPTYRHQIFYHHVKTAEPPSRRASAHDVLGKLQYMRVGTDVSRQKRTLPNSLGAQYLPVNLSKGPRTLIQVTMAPAVNKRTLQATSRGGLTVGLG